MRHRTQRALAHSRLAALKLGIQYVVFLEARLFSPSYDPPRARYARTYTRAFSSALEARGCAWMYYLAGDAYVRGYQRTTLLLVRFDCLIARWKPTDGYDDDANRYGRAEDGVNVRGNRGGGHIAGSRAR